MYPALLVLSKSVTRARLASDLGGFGMNLGHSRR